MKANDKVVCVDDTFRTNPSVKSHGDMLQKGNVYVIRETFPPSMKAMARGEVVAITLVGIWAGEHFDGDEVHWCGSRFRPVSEVGHPPIAVEQPQEVQA